MKVILVSALLGLLMVAYGVANAAVMPGSACVAEGEDASNGIIGSQGEYIWKDTSQSKRVHCPNISNAFPPKLIFNVGNASNDTLTCTVKRLSLGRTGGGLQSGGSTVSSKKVGYGAVRLRVTGAAPTRQTIGYISYCSLPAAIGNYRGAASVIFNVAAVN